MISILMIRVTVFAELLLFICMQMQFCFGLLSNDGAFRLNRQTILVIEALRRQNSFSSIYLNVILSVIDSLTRTLKPVVEDLLNTVDTFLMLNNLHVILGH